MGSHMHEFLKEGQLAFSSFSCCDWFYGGIVLGAERHPVVAEFFVRPGSDGDEFYAEVGACLEALRILQSSVVIQITVPASCDHEDVVIQSAPKRSHLKQAKS